MLTDEVINVGELFKLILENEDNVNVMYQLVRYLTSKNANPNIINKDTPLLHVTCGAASNPMLLTLLLLTFKADPNIQSTNFMKISALHQVCGPFYAKNSFAQNGLLEILLNNGADPNVGDSLMKTPFHYYCMSPNINEASLRLFLQKNADPLRISHDKTFPFGNLLNNPLVTLQHVKIFFEHGLNPNSPILEMKSTIFHLVCRHEAIKDDILTYFIEQGADASIKNEHGITPVHYYLQRKTNISSEMLAKLLQNIKNVDIANNLGQTLLYYACRNSCASPQTVQWLIEKGANPNYLSNDKITPFAVYFINIETVSSGILRIFFNNKADCNIVTGSGYSVFHALCIKDTIEDRMLVKALRHGANPNILDEDGRTSVHLYLSRKKNINYNAFVELMSSLNDINFMVNNDQQTTVLYYACKNPFVNTQIVRFLLEKNANVSQQLLFAKFLKTATKRNNELNVLLRKYFISNDKNIICNQKSSKSSQLITKEFFIEKDEDWNNLVAMKPGSVDAVKQKKKFYLFMQVDSEVTKNSLLHIQIANSRDGSIDFGIDLQQTNNANDLLDYFVLRQKMAAKFSMNKPCHELALSVQNSQGETPMLVALKTANPVYALSLLILDKLAKTIDVADNAGRTPLHIAYLFGLDDIVDFLLQRKANEDAVDICNKKPRDYLLCDKDDKKKYIEEVLNSVSLFNSMVFQEKDKEMVINCLLEKNQDLQEKLFPQISLNKEN